VIARLAAILFTIAAGVSCRTAGVAPAPQLVQPGAPGEASRVITASAASDLSKIQVTAADVRFMQGMIGHHAQAVEMVALMPTRTSSQDILMLGRRIDASQTDEIHMMQRWLEIRGHTLPDPHAHHLHGATLMPGMLTEEEMGRLAEAKDADFERLFLEGMMTHHAGALTMVKELFDAPGAGQESEIFAFASDVDADQRIEIKRMSAMLMELRK